MVKYDAELVSSVKKAIDDGQSPIDILQAGEIDVTSETLMAILRDGGEHGWDDISAESSFLDDDDDEVEEVEAVEPDLKPPSYADAEDDGVAPSVAAEQAKEIAAKAKTKGAARPRAKKKAAGPARGQKRSNTTKTKLHNKERRKRRGGNPALARKRLQMDMDKAHPDFVHRWVLDRPGRIREMQEDDYDIVTDAHVDEAMGGSVSASAGTNHYAADNMILMRKFREWYNQDQEDKLEPGRELERQINGQNTAASSTLVDQVGPEELIERLKNGGIDTSHTYVPLGEKNQVGQVAVET